MPVFLVIAFIFFIAIDILIFLKMWNFVIVGLVFGAVLVIIGLILKAFTPAEKETSPSALASRDSIYSNSQAPQGLQKPQPEQGTDSGGMSFGVILFIIESAAVFGLLLYLFLR